MAATRLNWTHFGLPVYELDADGAQYAVGTEKQASKAASLAVEDRLWGLGPEFLVAFLQRHNPFLRDMTDAAAESLEGWLGHIGSELAEDAEPLIRALVGAQFPTLIEDALRFIGRPFFLAPYDGKEHDSDDIEELPTGRLAYRLS